MTTTTEIKAAAEKGRIARAAGLVSAMTLVSRLLGLLREQVFAILLGAGVYSDAFRIGFRVPNLLRDLFAEGALSAAFVPTYARVSKEAGQAEAFRLANRVLSLLAALLGALVLLGIVYAGPLVAALAPGFEKVAGKTELTVLLTRIMMPFLPLVSFAAVAMGMLNAEERFAMPALSPALFNVVTIGWAGVLWAMGLPPEKVAVGWAVGTLLGGLAQFLCQVPSLWRAGWRPRLEWAPLDPALGRMARLMAPATVGLAAVQVNIFVNSIFASHEPGAVSWLNYAFRILYLPIGVFGVAVGTIATTGLARRAAAGDWDGLKQTLRQSIQMVAFLTIPSTVGLVVLRRPIVALLYQRGRFGPEDVEQTATALAVYSLGLVAYTGVKVLAPAFYALGLPRVPLLASVCAVATNLLINMTLYRTLGFRSVALGTALAALVNALILAAVFERRLGGLRSRRLFGSLVRMLVAAAAMAATAWSCVRLLAPHAAPGLAGQSLLGIGPVAVGAVTYLMAARVLQLPEASELFGLLRRRFRPAS